MVQFRKITSTDFLAGGGGVTEAMKQIENMECVAVLNHSKVAIRTNMFHHKDVKHYLADIKRQDEHQMEPVDFAWFSIECTMHSKANGGRAKKVGSYMLGWEAIRYIIHLDPYMIGIENVPEFKEWSPIRLFEDKKKSTKKYCALMFDPTDNEYFVEPIPGTKGQEFSKWKKTIEDLGYEYHESIRNAADDGMPTRRVRYFAFFTKIELGMKINWPAYTHNKNGTHGLLKWEPCRPYIDLGNEGQSIFGRQYNEHIAKGKRIPLVDNSQRRIVGGIKKLNPEMYMIMAYYGNGLNVQSIDAPLNTVNCKDRHALIKLEKFQFLQDYYSRDDTATSLDAPANSIRTENSKHLMTMQFISVQNNSNGNPGANNFSLDEPAWAATCTEKFQFISMYFNSSGHPESQNQSLDQPLNAITTGANKQALVTALMDGSLDFDIKMRFLTPEELGCISTFAPGYFTNPRLKLTKADAIKLIGNAVPPKWAEMLIRPAVDELQQILAMRENQKYA